MYVLRLKQKFTEMGSFLPNLWIYDINSLAQTLKVADPYVSNPNLRICDMICNKCRYLERFSHLRAILLEGQL